MFINHVLEIELKTDSMKQNFVIPFLFFGLLQLSITISSAQDSAVRPVPPAAQAQVKVTDPSLSGQYREMLMRSRTQEGYKLVNPTRLTNLWNNTMDTLRAERRKRMDAEQKLSAGLQSVNGLKDSLERSKEMLDKSEAMVDQMSLLGIPVNKTVYNSIMWGAVLLLTLAVVILVFQTARYRREAVYRVKLFEELSAEYQTHKIKANEREKKLARELQDERNKLDELTNRDKL